MDEKNNWSEISNNISEIKEKINIFNWEILILSKY